MEPLKEIGVTYESREPIDASQETRAAEGSLHWTDKLREIFTQATRHYQSGVKDPDRLFGAEERTFLTSIGGTAHELFDYVEDWCEDGEPSLDTVLAIASVRNQYFVSEQGLVTLGHSRPSSAFPAGSDRLGDIPWLPRIIAKARAKLRGELPSELMYGCGADRPFLKRVGIEPAEFLKIVWNAGSDDAILALVQDSMQNRWSSSR